MEAYLHWQNRPKMELTMGCCPEQRYSGGRDPEWYRKLVAALKLESVLPLSCADGG